MAYELAINSVAFPTLLTYRLQAIGPNGQKVRASPDSIYFDKTFNVWAYGDAKVTYGGFTQSVAASLSKNQRVVYPRIASGQAGNEVGYSLGNTTPGVFNPLIGPVPVTIFSISYQWLQ